MQLNLPACYSPTIIVRDLMNLNETRNRLEEHPIMCHMRNGEDGYIIGLIYLNKDGNFFMYNTSHKRMVAHILHGEPVMLSAKFGEEEWWTHINSWNLDPFRAIGDPIVRLVDVKWHRK